MYILIKYFLCVFIFASTYGKPVLLEGYTYSINTNNYYKLHERKANWQDALATCKSEGAQLFYPVDEAEASEVNTLLSPWSDRNYIWIGVSDLRLEGSYETIDGRPLSEVHHRWDVEWYEPDRSNGGHCVVMWNEYELWLKPCKDENAFICKYGPESSQDDDDDDDGTEYTTSEAEITESSTTVAIETTTITTDSSQSGDDNAVLPTEAVNDQSRSQFHFGNLVGEELKRFKPKGKLQIMVSILEVIRDYETTHYEQVVGSEPLEPGDIFQ